METSTQLVIPKRVASSVEPKPTKQEIIEALARRAIAKMVAERDELAVKKNDLVGKAKAALQAYAEEQGKEGLLAVEAHGSRHSDKLVSSDDGGRGYWTYKWSFSLTAELNPPDRIKRMFEAAEKVGEDLQKIYYQCAHTNMAEMKRRIRANMEGAGYTKGNRVEAILSNPAAVKGLDTMLAAFDKSKIEEPAVAV